jgi:hypothetical protein
MKVLVDKIKMQWKTIKKSFHDLDIDANYGI